MYSLDFFGNDYYKVLSFLYDNQIQVKEDKVDIFLKSVYNVNKIRGVIVCQ